MPFSFRSRIQVHLLHTFLLLHFPFHEPTGKAWHPLKAVFSEKRPYEKKWLCVMFGEELAELTQCLICVGKDKILFSPEILRLPVILPLLDFFHYGKKAKIDRASIK